MSKPTSSDNDTAATFSRERIESLLREARALEVGDLEDNDTEHATYVYEALQAQADEIERLRKALCCYDCKTGECEHLPGESCESYVERGCDCKNGRVPA